MKDQEIKKRHERLMEIIRTLEEGDPSMEEARELREEAEALIDDLREQLVVGDGTVEFVNQ